MTVTSIRYVTLMNYYYIILVCRTNLMIRICNTMQNIDGIPMRNFYSQDGEAEILIPAMTEVVQAAFQGANTDFIKGPPPATGIHQTNDRNSVFRDTKAGMATVTKGGIDCSNPTLAANVRNALSHSSSNILRLSYRVQMYPRL